MTKKTVRNVGSNETLRSLAHKHLGDFELWQNIADINGLTPWDDLTGKTIILPEAGDIIKGNDSEFINLENILTTQNNWKTLSWI